MKSFLIAGIYGIEEECVSLREDNAFRMALATSAVKYRVSVEYRRIAEEPGIRETVTAALKYTENKLRALLGVKSRLAVKYLSTEYSRIIDSYFDELFERVNRERIKANRPEYEKLYEADGSALSIEGADEIERVSWQNTARLIVEQEESEQPLQPFEAQSAQADDGDSVELDYGLLDCEIKFVSYALSEEFDKMQDISVSVGSIPDAMADKINEVFCDNFGDVILENLGDGYTVIPDYREDIENWLTKIQK